MTVPSTSNDIARLLMDREARAAERRISLVRGVLLVVALFVLMPIRVARYGFEGGSGSFWFSVAVLVLGLLGTLYIGWRMRAPDFPPRMGLYGLFMDFGILAALIWGQVPSGFTPSVQQSMETYQILLPLGYVMNALSGLRLSHRQVLLSGALCLGLVVQATLIDMLMFGAPFYAFTTGVAVSLVAVTTTASYFIVTKARSLLGEASSMQSEALRVRGVLSRYVSQPVAETVLQEDLSLSEGRRQRVTVLFSDIRGFTKMSELMPPEEVVSVLNAYFSRMVRVVFAYEGMLDKYIGDGMMVVFGAPIPREDHALRAVQAALRMRAELAIFNDERLARGEPALQIGIGIHTGEAVIGNIGTEQRLDYTAIGDTVNTASRIESLTKEFGTDILISSETYAEVMAQVEAEAVPNVQIRGKTMNLDLFKLEALKPEATVADRVTSRLPAGRTPTKFLW